MLTSIQTYSDFIYTLTVQYASIRQSTLALVPLGASIASLCGELYFADDVVLRVVEELDFLAQRIDYYSYTVSKAGERLYWYDPQPHPDVPALQSTHPHHKHVPPDIKHNRIPAPGISFTNPNLPFLIQEIEQTLFSNSLPDSLLNTKECFREREIYDDFQIFLQIIMQEVKAELK